MNGMMGMVMGFEGMTKGIKHIPGPEGVRGRNSDNKLILEKLGWEPTIALEVGARRAWLWAQPGRRVWSPGQVPRAACTRCLQHRHVTPLTRCAVRHCPPPHYTGRPAPHLLLDQGAAGR